MPREVAHWNILQLAAQKLRQTGAGATADLLEANKGAAFLGALAPDVPYYYRFGGTAFQNAAEMMHGKDGEDTFDALRSFVAHLQQEESAEREYLASFVLGYISHCVADWHFHPMIYYLTGDYYAVDPVDRAAAQTYHRAFEVYLDAWFSLHGPTLWNRSSVSKLLGHEGSKLGLVCQMLAASPVCAIGVEAEAASAWLRGYRDLAFIQRLCVSTPIGYSFRALNKLIGGRFTPFAALAKSGRPVERVLFDAPFAYRNPLSGIELEERVDSLRDQAIAELVDISKQLEPVWRGSQENTNKLLSEMKGKSLNLGLVEAKIVDAKYYSPSPPAFLLNE